MDKESLRKAMLDAVEDYVASPEAWDEAYLCIDTLTGEVTLREEEETDALPDTTDVYYIMDFVEMTPEGSWIASPENVDAALNELS